MVCLHLWIGISKVEKVEKKIERDVERWRIHVGQIQRAAHPPWQEHLRTFHLFSSTLLSGKGKKAHDELQSDRSLYPKD